jgi:hypothetical protein
VRDVSPQLQALMATRRLLVLAVAFYVVGAAVTLGLVRGVNLIGPNGIVVGLSVGLLALAVFVLRGEVQLWISFMALLVLTAAIFLPNEASEAWLPVPNLTVSVAYLGILITSRWWSGVWIVVGLSLSISALVLRPSQVVSWAPEMPLAWIVVAQLLAACMLLWWTFQRLRSEASTLDGVHRQLQRQTEVAIARQERSRAWRKSAVALHESILNTIGYLLQSPNLDRKALVEQSRNPAPFVLDHPLVESHTVEDVVARSRRMLSIPLTVTVIGGGADATLTPAVSGALRVAAVEVMRNAFRHGAAAHVKVVAIRGGNSRVLLTITDDGIGIRGSMTTGIGLTQALSETITDVGGHVEVNTTDGHVRVDMDLPVGRSEESRRVVPVPFNHARLLVSAILVAYVAVGIAYVPFHFAERGAAILPTDIGLVLVAIVAVTIFFRAGNIRWAIKLTGALLAVAVPWFLALGEVACGQDSVLPAILNVSGFAVLALSVWLRTPWALGLLLVWAAGGIFLITRAPMGCRQGLIYAEFNALLVVPLVLGIAYMGLKQATNARRRMENLEVIRTLEATQARAWEDFNAELADTVQRASHLIDRVAEGEELSDVLVRELICCDARIRAGIQIDPQSTGNTGRLARDLIAKACDVGVHVKVRSLESEEGSIEVPVQARFALISLVQRPTAMTIQVLDDGSSDQLSMTLLDVSADEVRALLAQVHSGFDWEVLEADQSGEERVHVLIRIPRINVRK